MVNRNTVKASYSNMPNVVRNAKMWKKKKLRSGECFLDNALIEMIWKYIVKKRQINAPNSIMAGDLGIHLKYTLEKSQKMRICLLSGRKFEETFENAQWIA